MATLRNASVNVLLLVIAVAVGRFLQMNPMWYGGSVGPSALSSARQSFHVFEQHAVLDSILMKHSNELGDDYIPYRNHCLRVLSFSVHHLGGVEKVAQRRIDLLAAAIAYHDIALWTDGALNYLAPSNACMEREMKALIAEANDREEKDGGEEEQKLVIPILNDDELETAREIIMQHHKFTEWQPSSSSDTSKVDADLVNAVRMADWADFTVGLVSDGRQLQSSHIEAAYVAVPDAGFHWMLAGMGGRLSPDSWMGQLAVLKILRW